MRDERNASPLTLDAYERDLLRFATGLPGGAAEGSITGVTSEDIRAHMRVLNARGLAPATVRRALYAIASFFKWAHRWDLVTTNPAARVTIPRRKRVREVRSLTKRERAIVIAAADRLARESHRPIDSRAPLLIRLMMRAGLRRAEVLGLAWRDVDCDGAGGNGELLVRHGKGDKSRRVPLEDRELLRMLQEHRVARSIGAHVDDGSERTTVLTSTYGTRLPESSFYKIFRRVLAVAELDGRGITPHSLRHTFGSVLCARGVPVGYVRDLLGHEDIGSTMVYVHSTPAALRAAVRKLRE